MSAAAAALDRERAALDNLAVAKAKLVASEVFRPSFFFKLVFVLLLIRQFVYMKRSAWRQRSGT
jgi:hypothetical protein